MSKKYLVYDAEKQEFRELREEDYESNYEMISQNVGGLICCANYFPFNGVDAWVNDEGLLMDLPYVCMFEFGNNRMPLAGNIVFTRTNIDGETIPLTDEDIIRIKSYFGKATECYVDLLHMKMIPLFKGEV